MSTETQRILGDLMIKVGAKIKSGDCGLSEAEIDEMINIIGTKELSLEQTAKYLNCDRSTLTRQIKHKKIPQPRKEPGKSKYYFQKDLMKK